MTTSAQRRTGLVILLALALVGLLAYGVLGRALGETTDTGPSEAQPVAAPAFSLDVLELGTPSPRLEPLIERVGSDGRITLRELRGTPVVLNFWASWCEYCRSETPLLEATWKQAAADGVVILGVDTKDVSADARAFLRERP